MAYKWIMGPQLSIEKKKLLKNDVFLIGEKLDSEVKTDDKFCINISYKHEEDEKFYVFFNINYVNVILT